MWLSYPKICLMKLFGYVWIAFRMLMKIFLIVMHFNLLFEALSANWKFNRLRIFWVVKKELLFCCLKTNLIHNIKINPSFSFKPQYWIGLHYYHSISWFDSELLFLFSQNEYPNQKQEADSTHKEGRNQGRSKKIEWKVIRIRSKQVENWIFIENK